MLGKEESRGKVQLAFAHRHPMVLATDLDGTLIPLPDHPQNERDLRTLSAELSRTGTPLIFVTGRHLESVLEIISHASLPVPDWIICDVGSAIFQRSMDGAFHRTDAYSSHLAGLLGHHTVETMFERLGCIEHLTRQEEAKQTQFKLSFYTPRNRLESCSSAIEQALDDGDYPFSLISSVDPFDNLGLIDLLPRGVSKAFAIGWWCERMKCGTEQIVFAGDSGNDLAVLTSGCRAIIVGNASPDVRAAAVRAHQQNGWSGRLYTARDHATSGVLEGIKHFLGEIPPA